MKKILLWALAMVLFSFIAFACDIVTSGTSLTVSEYIATEGLGANCTADLYDGGYYISTVNMTASGLYYTAYFYNMTNGNDYFTLFYCQKSGVNYYDTCLFAFPGGTSPVFTFMVCPATSTTGVLLIVVFFAILCILLLWSKMYLKLPIITMLIYLGFITLGFYVMPCEHFIGVLLMAVAALGMVSEFIN